jgi:hypothetical protein
MGQGFVSEGLVFTQPLKNDSVSTFAEYLYLAIWHSDDSRHSLPSGVEFANVEDFKLLILSLYIDKDRFWLACLNRNLQDRKYYAGALMLTCS